MGRPCLRVLPVHAAVQPSCLLTQGSRAQLLFGLDEVTFARPVLAPAPPPGLGAQHLLVARAAQACTLLEALEALKKGAAKKDAAPKLAPRLAEALHGNPPASKMLCISLPLAPLCLVIQHLCATFDPSTDSTLGPASDPAVGTFQALHEQVRERGCRGDRQRGCSGEQLAFCHRQEHVRGENQGGESVASIDKSSVSSGSMSGSGLGSACQYCKHRANRFATEITWACHMSHAHRGLQRSREHRKYGSMR